MGLAGGEQEGGGAPRTVKVMRVCIESRHNYAPNTHLAVTVRVPQAAGLRVSLDSRCDCKADLDRLALYSDSLLKQPVGMFNGPCGGGNWASPPDIKCNAVTVIFESDANSGEWGFKLYIQPLDDSGQAVAVGQVLFESVPAYTQGLRGKLDVTLQSDDMYAGLCRFPLFFFRLRTRSCSLTLPR